MSRAKLGIHWSSRLRRALGLGLSGAALVGLVYFEGVSARAQDADAQEAGDLAEDEWDEEDEAEAVRSAVSDAIEASKPAAPPSMAAQTATAEPGTPPEIMPAAMVKADVREAMAKAKAGAPAAEPVLLAKADVAAAEAGAGEMPSDPAAELVVVPDLKGMSLRKARQELKAIGLKLSVRDEWGYKVDREAYRYYKVRSQKIEAGTKLEAGSWVRVKARERYEVFQGY